MVVSLERGADLHMAQLTPLPLTVSCFSKIQIGFTFLVPAHLSSPRKRAVKWVCVYTDIAVRSLTCHTTVCVTLPNQSQQSRSSATANDMLYAEQLNPVCENLRPPCNYHCSGVFGFAAVVLTNRYTDTSKHW